MSAVRRPLLLAAALTTVAVAGCASREPIAREIKEGEVPTGQPVLVLRIRNESVSEQVLYLQTGQERRRIGSVVGTGSTTLAIPARRLAPGQLVRVVADPVGSGAFSSTGDLNVRPGNTVEFIIGPVPAQSRVFIR